MIDKSGGIGGLAATLQDALSKTSPAELLDKLDTDRDGGLSAEELCRLGETAEAQDFSDLLEKYDRNGDGVLDDAELARLIARLRGEDFAEETSGGSGGQDGGSGGQSGGEKSGGSGGGQGVAEKDSDALLEKYDGNGDGKLDAGELEALAEGEGVELEEAGLLGDFDANGDGGLDSAELKAAYERILSDTLGGTFNGR